jgi:hypothetical protein
MREHVELTIRDLGDEIARLQDAMKVLQGLGPAKLEVLVVPKLAEPVRPRTPMARTREGRGGDLAALPAGGQAVAPPSRKVGAPGGSDGASRARNSALVQGAAAALAEPWTKLDLATATGISKANAANYVNRWVRWGWAVKMGYAKYQRTPEWGGGQDTEPQQGNKALQAPTHAALAARREAGRDLEAAMETALRDRDRANAAGNEKLAAIHQKKIDQLEAAMGK